VYIANVEKRGQADLTQQQRLREEVINALKEIYDPEIPVNIVDLGLIYNLDIDLKGNVLIRMTLTAPACPVAQSFPDIVANRIRKVPGVEDVLVDLVWDPPWSQERLSDAVRLQLDLL
jgi:FeS assembly SUF system protein